MKLFSKIILSLTILAAVFTGCKKDDSSPETNFVRAKINGVTYNADSISSIVGSGQVSIQSSCGVEKIIINFPENASGNHSINFSTYNVMYFDKTGAIYTAQSGAINISKYDAAGRAIEGNFNAKLYNGTANPSLTDGVFNILY